MRPGAHAAGFSDVYGTTLALRPPPCIVASQEPLERDGGEVLLPSDLASDGAAGGRPRQPRDSRAIAQSLVATTLFEVREGGRRHHGREGVRA